MSKDLDKQAAKALRRKRFTRRQQPDAVTLIQTIAVAVTQTKQAAREGIDAELEIRIDF